MTTSVVIKSPTCFDRS